tara:strand:+ start:1651 stop:2196 length:546 start_codon:yes stop_codon:yes gene_type:complete
LLLKEIFENCKGLIGLSQDTLIKVTSDDHETGNAFILVFAWSSITSLSYFNRVGLEILYPVFDHLFAWVIGSFGAWFLLVRVFRESLNLQGLITLTGYSHVILYLILFLAKFNTCDNPLLGCSFNAQITTIFLLLLIFWFYFVIQKGLQVGYIMEKKSASSASIVFLVILFFYSDLLKLFI